MAQTANKTAREIAMERRRLSYESGKAGIQKMQSSGAQATVATSAPASGNVDSRQGLSCQQGSDAQ